MERLTRRDSERQEFVLVDRPRGALCRTNFCNIADRCVHIPDRICPYTGSIVVKLHNHGPNPYTVRRGDKISQLVVVDIHLPHIQLVDELDKTERGAGGFGSTGR